MFLKKGILLYVLGGILLLSSCSGYEKLLKSKDHNLKYNAALEFYNNKKYSKAVRIFEQLLPIYRGTERAAEVNYYQAKCYYRMKDYYMAGYYFNNFAKTFPRDERVEEAEYLVAHSFYLTSPRPLLDQDITNKAMAAYRMFLMKYPNTDKKAEINKNLIELRDKLVEKSYLNAKLYFDLEYYKSALTAIKNALNDYPDTKYREEMMYLMLRSSFLLADNSVQDKKLERFQNTVDEYYSFISEFPESKHIKEAEKMHAHADQNLK